MNHGRSTWSLSSVYFSPKGNGHTTFIDNRMKGRVNHISAATTLVFRSIFTTTLTSYWVLIEGLSPLPDDDVILDFKVQRRPAPTYYFGARLLKQYVDTFGDNDAARHNVGYHRLTPFVDKFVGEFIDRRKGNSYAVREVSPYKGNFPFKKYAGNVGALQNIFEEIGRIVARAHVRARPQGPLVGGSVEPLELFLRREVFGGNANESDTTSSSEEMIQRNTTASSEFSELAYALAHHYAARTAQDQAIFAEGLNATSMRFAAGEVGSGPARVDDDNFGLLADGEPSCLLPRFADADPAYLAGGGFEGTHAAASRELEDGGAKEGSWKIDPGQRLENRWASGALAARASGVQARLGQSTGTRQVVNATEVALQNAEQGVVAGMFFEANVATIFALLLGFLLGVLATRISGENRNARTSRREEVESQYDRLL